MPTTRKLISLTTLSVLTATCFNTTADAAVRWKGSRASDGTITFMVQDQMTGLENALTIDPEIMRHDRPVMVSLDVDADAGRQGLSLVWTDSEGVVQTDRLDLDNILTDEFNVSHARFRVDRHQSRPMRIDESMTDALGQVEIDVLGPAGELFDVLQTDRAQVDPEFGLPGDVTADGHVLVDDILQVVSNWEDWCPEGADCPGDVDNDAVIGIADLLVVLQQFGQTAAADDGGPSRLIHFQLVGGSWTGDANGIHPQVYTDEEGWGPLLENQLQPIADQAAFGWDLWMHNPAGYWYDHDYTWRAPDGETQPMVFEQFAFARSSRPNLLELDPVRDFMEGRSARMYGYVGLPRTYPSSTGDWTQQPDHGSPDEVGRFYGDLLQQGFRGVGHDASAHHPADSPWVTSMVPELRARGVEVFLESIPMRNKPHLLGQSVVAEYRHWQGFSEALPNMFFSEDEITEAGGRAIYLVGWPLGMAPGDSGYDPDFNLHQWQMDTALELLGEGKTVAINMAGLVRHGYDITPLVVAAQ